MSNAFALYVFMLNIQAYAMLPIENNPFPTHKACEIIALVINETKITTVGPYTFRVSSATCPKEQAQ
jgi:hypothetical protein